MIRKESYGSNDIKATSYQSGIKRGHPRKTSVLAKGMQVSRHERNKSKNTLPTSLTSEAVATFEQLDTQGGQIYQMNQFAYNSNFESNILSQQSTTPQSSMSSSSLNAFSPMNGAEGPKGIPGKHRRIPSYLKTIPLTKVNKPTNINDQDRKKAYEAIVQKITSNQTTNTLNDDDLESHINYQSENQMQQNNRYVIDSNNNDIYHDPQLTFKEGYSDNQQNNKIQIDDDPQLAQVQNAMNPSKSSPVDIHKRALMSRQQARSDQLCLQIIDSVIEEQESLDIESYRVKDQKPKHTKTATEVQLFQGKHTILTEDGNQFTEGQDDPNKEIKLGKIKLEETTGNNDNEDDIILFIEYKYCTICHVEQPLRTKHCKYCDHCVATYDHHCPWIGNCVGERNRFDFYWFLLFQSSQLVTAIITIGYILSPNSVEQINKVMQILIIVALLLIIGFFFMVSSLLIFHTFLISKNLTTCKQSMAIILIGEYLSWMKISYMKVWPKRYGSPFNRGGMWRNFKLFCCYKFNQQKFIFNWKMPNKLPKLK